MTEESESRNVDSGVLRVYDLPPDDYGEVTMWAEIDIDFVLPHYDDKSTEDATVEVEIKYNYLGLDRTSLVHYLAEFAHIEVTPEDIACQVRRDLSDILETDDVYVNVRQQWPTKNVRVGSAI